MIQRTDEWHAARLGKVTASRIDDVMGRTKTGYGAGRKNYMAEKIVEILTGKPYESYTNSAMQWGTDHEDEARQEYANVTWDMIDDITEVGFVDHPTISGAGASPDGLVGSDGLIEIKCPNTATHLETILTKTIDKKYILQMQWQMACTGRKWCDFVSYDPRLDGKLRIFIKRVDRDDNIISEIEKEAMIFIAELNDTVKKLREVAA